MVAGDSVFEQCDEWTSEDKGRFRFNLLLAFLTDSSELVGFLC